MTNYDEYLENEKKKKERPFENDPILRFDAFTAGMKNGGLRSVTSIQLLVCYVVASINGKVTAQNIIDTVNEGMLANHFEISDAIDKLLKKGTLIEADDGAITLTHYDKESIDLIERDLPLTVRETAVKLCQKIIAKETYKRENKAEVTKTDKGYTVSLNVTDGQTEYLALELYAPTIEQAEAIKDKFITDPVQVYNTLIDSIFKN